MPKSGIAPAVGSRFGIGEREARNLEALRQAREVVVLLLLGAVVDEELAGPSEFGTITVTAPCRCAWRSW
jgi:hypothetical protein